MDPKYIPKITRLAQIPSVTKTKNGSRTDGPYWHGFWMEDGKERKVYIGKVLPPELEIILSTSAKPPGRKYFSWPGRPQRA